MIDIDKIRINIKGHDYRRITKKVNSLKETSNLKLGDVTYTGRYNNVFVSIKEYNGYHKFYLDFSPHVFLKGNNIDNISFQESLTALDKLASELEIDEIQDFEITSLHIAFNYNIGYPVIQFTDSIDNHLNLNKIHRFKDGLSFENSIEHIQYYNKGLEAHTGDLDLLRVEYRIKDPKSLLKMRKLHVSDLHNSEIQNKLFEHFKISICETVIHHKPRSFKFDVSQPINWQTFRKIMIDNYLSDTEILDELVRLIDSLPSGSFTSKNQSRIIQDQLKKHSNNISIIENRKHRTLEDLVGYVDRNIIPE